MNKGKQLKAVYDRLKIGDKITVHQAVEASYSNYAGNPTILFTPEDVAIVTNVRIPCQERRIQSGVRQSFVYSTRNGQSEWLHPY
jgi:hypothetical protein